MQLITKFPKQSLVEAGQTKKHKFFWCHSKEDKLVPVTPKIKCRDYFNEAWYKWYTGTTLGTVYGFSAEHVQKNDGSPVYMGMSFEYCEGERENLEKNLPLLFDLEKVNGFVPSEIVYFDNEHIVFSFDQTWLDNPTLFYLYHWSLRLLTYPMSEFPNINSKGTDDNLLKANDGKVKKLLLNPRVLVGIDPKIIEELDPTEDSYTYHNCVGANNVVIRHVVGKKDVFVKALESLL